MNQGLIHLESILVSYYHILDILFLYEDCTK